MIKDWLKMKKQEMAIKSFVYGTILKVLNENSEIIELTQNLYNVLKDTSIDELRSEFIKNLARIIHEETHSKE